MHLKQDYQFRTLWDVIGRVKGSELPDEWVVAGNHRDAWVYGAVDPNSGTAAMLEAVHGVGELLKSGWKPKRTLVFGSWDGEEEGLIGSTEWVEQHEADLAQCARVFQCGRCGLRTEVRRFRGSQPQAVPARRHQGCAQPERRNGLRELAKSAQPTLLPRSLPTEAIGDSRRTPAAQVKSDVPVGDLGSGSDYTAFLQHLGVPSTDVSSSGPYGVYHSVFDNFAWFKKFGDPDFLYEQEMARVLGLKSSAWPTPMFCPTTTKNTAKKSTAYLDAAQRERKTNSATMHSTSTPSMQLPIILRRRAQRFSRSKRILRATRLA